MIMEYSKSKKKSQNNQINVQNQKVMMKISSSKNSSGIASVILLGGAFITAALGSAFLVERKRRKSTQKITKKENNKNSEDGSSKGLHFLLPDSSPCIEQQQVSSNATEKLCVDDSISLFFTPCLIQDEKPKLGMDDEKRDSQTAIVSDHPKEEEKSPSFERLTVDKEELELSEIKISLLPDPDQELNKVTLERIHVIQGNEKTEMATILYKPSLQVDNKREFSVNNKHNDKGELSELQHTDMIETDNYEAVLIQEQQNQAIGDQEILSPDGSLPESSTSSEQDFLPVQLYSVPLFEHKQLNYAHGQGNKAVETIELIKAADEDEHKDHMQITDLEEQCADVETQIDQIAKNCNLKMQCNDENERFKENDQANSCNEKATSEHSPCRTYTMVVQNVAASAIKNPSIDDQHSDMIEPNNHEGNLIQEQENQSMGDKGIINPDDSLPESSTSSEQEFSPIQLYSVPGFEHEPQAVETIDLMQAAYKDGDKGQMQIMNFEEQCVDAETQIDQFAKKCNLQMQFSDEQERSTENDQANSCCEEATSENSPCSLAASAIRNASIDDQHSAEVVQVIKETNATDITQCGEQSLEAEHSPIRFEKQSFERNYQGTGLEEDKETSETLAVNIEVVEKDLEARSREAEDEVAESVFVDKEEDDGYDNDIDKEDVADDISEGAENSSEQSNIEKVWPADSNQEFLLELKEKKVKEGMKIEDDETCCNSKSTQNEFDITSCQQSNDGKDDSAVNVTERYRTKLINLDDVAAITRRRRVLLGGLLALICYLCLKAFSLPRF